MNLDSGAHCAVDYCGSSNGHCELCTPRTALFSFSDWLVMNYSPDRFFQIIFKDIQIQLGTDVRPVFNGGFLRVVRRLAPSIALLVAAIFFAGHTKQTHSPWAVLNTARLETEELLSSRKPDYQQGFASWYGSEDDGFQYRTTANGEIMDPEAWTCAHPTLPFGTLVKVENLYNERSAILRVNDRGPYIRGRVIDVSLRGAEEIGILYSGIAQVRIQIFKNILHSNNLEAAGMAETTVIAPALLPFSFENVDFSMLFVSLADVVRVNGVVRQASVKFADGFFQSIEEIIHRIKNRRLDPFINRSSRIYRVW